MKLKAKINEVVYDIVQGAHFSEEYNETLDSGSIIIAHTEKMRNLKPYDDVFIYDNEFSGYNPDGLIKKSLEPTKTIEQKKLYSDFSFSIPVTYDQLDITSKGAISDVVEYNVKILYTYYDNTTREIKYNITNGSTPNYFLLTPAKKENPKAMPINLVPNEEKTEYFFEIYGNQYATGDYKHIVDIVVEDFFIYKPTYQMFTVSSVEDQYDDCWILKFNDFNLDINQILSSEHCYLELDNLKDGEENKHVTIFYEASKSNYGVLLIPKWVRFNEDENQQYEIETEGQTYYISDIYNNSETIGFKLNKTLVYYDKNNLKKEYNFYNELDIQTDFFTDENLEGSDFTFLVVPFNEVDVASTREDVEDLISKKITFNVFVTKEEYKKSLEIDSEYYNATINFVYEDDSYDAVNYKIYFSGGITYKLIPQNTNFGEFDVNFAEDNKSFTFEIDMLEKILNKKVKNIILTKFEIFTDDNTVFNVYYPQINDDAVEDANGNMVYRTYLAKNLSSNAEKLKTYPISSEVLGIMLYSKKDGSDVESGIIDFELGEDSTGKYLSYTKINFTISELNYTAVENKNYLYQDSDKNVYFYLPKIIKFQAGGREISIVISKNEDDPDTQGYYIDYSGSVFTLEENTPKNVTTESTMDEQFGLIYRNYDFSTAVDIEELNFSLNYGLVHPSWTVNYTYMDNSTEKVKYILVYDDENNKYMLKSEKNIIDLTLNEEKNLFSFEILGDIFKNDGKYVKGIAPGKMKYYNFDSYEQITTTFTKEDRQQNVFVFQIPKFDISLIKDDIKTSFSFNKQVSGENSLKNIITKIEYSVEKKDDGYLIQPKDEKDRKIYPSSNFIEYENYFEFKFDSFYGIGTVYLGVLNILTDLFIIDVKSENFDFVLEDSTVYPTNNFYKHLLVDQFSEEILNLKDKVYKYKIELFSETKGLETVQLPNISITQPFDYNLKKSVYEYIVLFVDMYSPVRKICTDENKNIWRYEKKYFVDPNLEEIFGNVYAPDFTLNNPNLRDVLSQLMITKDCIPVVKDGVITYMDITKRTGEFNDNGVNYISSSLSSDNFCDNLKTSYSDALSQDNSCRFVEFMGFRNSNSPLLTLENMQIETSFPIYKINKIYMCYYKKGKVLKGSQETGQEKVFLCKQDITPLVLLNSIRNVLSKDWDKFGDTPPSTTEEMAEYKMCTVGYDIGSTHISGWGEKYTYPTGFWNPTATYIENILTILDTQNPYGIYGYDYIAKLGNIKKDETFSSEDYLKNTIIHPFNHTTKIIDAVTVINPLIFKSVFFEIDYNGFYSGTVVHSRDEYLGDFYINDNQNSSLSLLEKDGLYQKEKINRYGNKGYSIPARYKTPLEIQNLGTVYSIDDEDDIVIYHKDFSIFDNVVNCNYYGMKDYVLKNYFTSVYAKYRPFSLLSYGETINRAENKKMYLLLSKDSLYFEKEKSNFNYKNIENSIDFIDLLLSFYKKTGELKTQNYIEKSNKINYAYVEYNGNKYACDLNAFACGYSLCFNMQMYDNVTMGVYIEELDPDNLKIFDDVKDDFTGSVQNWYMTTDDIATGQIKKIGFYVAHINDNNFLDGEVKDFTEKIEGKEIEKYIKEDIYNKLTLLPKIDFDTSKLTNIIGGEYTLNKDNKEKLNMTFQIEPISKSKDVVFSQWMMKLTNLLSSYDKYPEDDFTEKEKQYGEEIQFLSASIIAIDSTIGYGPYYAPLMVLRISRTFFEEIKKETKEGFVPIFSDAKAEYTRSEYMAVTDDIVTSMISNVMIGYSFELKDLIELEKNENDKFTLKVKGTENYTVNEAGFGGTKSGYQTKTMNFVETEEIGGVDVEYLGSKEHYIYFANCNIYHDIIQEYKNDFGSYNNGKRSIYAACKKTVTDLTEGQQLDSKNSITSVCTLNTTPEEKVKLYRNIFLTFNDTNIKKEIVYDEIKNISDKEKGETGVGLNGTIVDNINNFLSYQKDETNGSEYLYLDLSSFTPEQLATFKSAQVWFDDDSGSYKFVFGVNLTEEDITNKYVKIYCSLVSNRDERVYDYKNQVIGTIENYVDSEKNYGEEQYFKKND